MTTYRLGQIRQQEYLQAAENARKGQPLGTMLWQAGDTMIALGKRLMAVTRTAPARTVTAPDITAEPCVEC
jgi:hypothetical protein